MTSWIVFLLLVICCVLALQQTTLETFCPTYTPSEARKWTQYKNKYIQALENTSDSGLDYIGCGKLNRSGLKDKENLFQTASFYTVRKVFSTFQEVAPFIIPTLQTLSQKTNTIGPVAVILRKLNSIKIEATYFFPNFTKEGEPITGYNALAKAHRWYHRVVYGYYKLNVNGQLEILRKKYKKDLPMLLSLNGKNSKNTQDYCINYTTTQCPGVPIRTVKQRPSSYNPTIQKCYYLDTDYDGYCSYDPLYYYTPNDYWIYYTYYTPCGTVKDKNYIYYTVYTLHPFHSLFNKFTIEPLHNISFLSEYEGLMYGCEFQLVSPQRKYVLVLEKTEGILSAPGLALYQIISGDPVLNCRNGTPLEKKKIWKIYLSKGNYTSPASGNKEDPDDYDPPRTAKFNYAHFKIDNDVIYLVDKDTVVWSYKIDAPRSPAIVQLSDTGSLDIYDSYNNKIDSLSIDMMKGVATGFKSSRYYINENWVLENERLYREIKQREMAKQNLQEDQEAQKRVRSYNKDICPIGLIEETFAPF